MSRQQIGTGILGQSFRVLLQHRKLLVFPALTAVAVCVFLLFFLAPLVYHTTSAELWNTLWNLSTTGRHARDAMPPEFAKPPFELLAATYLFSMFTATFVNFAFYSQVITALNGGHVSIRRGFALAVARLPAIVVWALFAGTIGVILRMIQERLPFFGQLLTGVLGLIGSVASVFVIPVMLNEPRSRNPLEHLRISANLIKRVWGAGLIGIAGVTGIAFMAYFCMFVLIFLAIATQQEWLIGLGFLGVFAIGCLHDGINGVFRCGLYIYATEGVAPGPFDADTMNRAWKVKDRSQ